MADKEMAPKDQLFEAIINIKKGHNKPNTQRICTHLNRKYGITANRCIKAINHYVITGDIEVVNPGVAAADLSYRVASSDQLEALASLDDIPSLQGSMINKFMAELIINEPNYLNDGVPPARLVSFVAEKQPELSRREIIESIRAELNSRNLDMFPNGNYGYCPVDSSDEEPVSEPEDKRRKVTPTASPSTRTKATTPSTGVPASAEKSNATRATAGPKPTVISKSSVTTSADKTNVERSNEKAQAETRVRGARTGRSDEKREDKESKENVKRDVKSENNSRRGEEEVERRGERMEKKEEWEEGGGSRRKWKKKQRGGWTRDAEFRPGSKDFKVDLSLERQARKRKERKIFDPSADDSKRSRRGRNGSKGEEVGPAATGAPNGTTGAKKMVSPVKKSPLAGTSVKVGSSMSVQCPPGGRAAITPLVPPSVCYLCQSYGKRTKGVPEKLISCLKCSTSKAHVTCLNDARGPNEKPMAPQANNSWTCNKCNLRCVYCNEEKRGIFILECTQCRAGFHVPCHRSLIPPLSKPSPLIPTLFKCVRCVPPVQHSQPSPAVVEKLKASQFPSTASDVDVMGVESSPLPKVTLTPLKVKVSPVESATDRSSVRPQPQQVQPQTTASTGGPKATTPLPLKLPDPRGPPAPDPFTHMGLLDAAAHDPFSHMGALDPAVPDVRGWSSGEVHKYLRRYLRPALCQPVVDDALDGHALLLMRRQDCVSRLGLPLGHAVLLWAHIRRLQTKRSDIVAMNYCEE